MLIDQETVSNKKLIINYIPMFILILELSLITNQTLIKTEH